MKSVIPPSLVAALGHCNNQQMERDLFDGYVYFVRCNEFVKIGIAKDPNARMAFMQTGNPYELELLRVFKSTSPAQDEEMIHLELDKYRVRGEWFKLPDKLINLIRNKELF